MITNQSSHIPLSLGNSRASFNPQLARKDLAIRITHYINHSKLIMMHSHSALYKVSSRWFALDFAIELLRLCGSVGNLRELCRHTLRVRHHLYTILPLQSNASYGKSCEDLDRIIADCKKYLTPVNYE